MRDPWATVLPALLILLLCAGCATQRTGSVSEVVISTTEQRPAGQAVPVSRPEPVGRWTEIGRTVQGREVSAWEAGEGRETILFLAAIHGNEKSGAGLLQDFIDHLERTRGDIPVHLVVIPIANPDGYAAGTRTNARGVDLNRNFPTSNFHPGGGGGTLPASEPETRALVRIIEARKPVLIVSVHSPLDCVDYDGPAYGVARRMASLSGTQLKKLGARSGSLGSYAGRERRIPTVTLELPAETGEQRSYWPEFKSAFLEILSRSEFSD